MGVDKMLNEVKKQTLTLVTAALGFVAALIWKDAIQAWLKPLYQDAQGALGLTLAAIVVTFVVVILTVVLAVILGEKEDKGKKK